MPVTARERRALLAVAKQWRWGSDTRWAVSVRDYREGAVLLPYPEDMPPLFCDWAAVVESMACEKPPRKEPR